jgi:hypothetical protein
MMEHVKTSPAIAYIGGDREGYIGIFSSGGHYVVIKRIENDLLVIWDPSMELGKYDKEGRAGKVTIREDEVLCTLEIIEAETENKTPRYFLFSKA